LTVQFPDFENFDELYAISDLHMGGRPGFQIFRQGPRLAELINYLTLRESDLQIALCINGDTVDFLAEPNPRYTMTVRIEMTIATAYPHGRCVSRPDVYIRVVPLSGVRKPPGILNQVPRNVSERAEPSRPHEKEVIY
jgi:hypothetical protein